MKFKYKKQILTKNLNKEFEFISQEIAKLKLPKGFEQFALYVISELFANIKEHSAATKTAVNLSISKTNFSLDIADNGIGLRESYLKKGIYPKDDFSAVEFALSGLSSKESKQRGFGFYTIKKLVKALNGVLNVTSGNVSVKVLKNRNESTIAKNRQGVNVFLKTPIKSIDFYKHIE